MRKLRLLSAALLLPFVFGACSKEAAPSTAEESSEQLVHKTFALSSTQTKTTLEGVNVLFKNGENVSIFDGEANRKFTVKGNGGNVTIAGDVSPDSYEYRAVSPYNYAAVYKNGQVTTTLSDEQEAVAGSFADGVNISAALSYDSESFSLHNVLSIAKISVAADNLAGHELSSIKLESRYPLAGDVVIVFGEEECWAVSGSKVGKAVTLKHASGEALADGTYYIALMPNDGGEITLTFTDTDGRKATKKATLSKPFTAGVIKNLGTVKALEWEEEATVVPAGTVLWADNFASYGKNSTTFSQGELLSGYTYAGRSGYEDNATSVTLSANNNNVRCFNQSTAGMSSGHLWFNKSTAAEVTTSAIKLYGVESVKLEYTKGKSGVITTSYSTNGTSWKTLGTAQSYTFSVDEGTSAVYLKFAHASNNSDNTRIDNLSLTAASAGSYTGGGNSGGDDQPDDPTPSEVVVKTVKASSVTSYQAVLYASYSGVDASIREAGFEWGTSSNTSSMEVLQVGTTPSGESGSFSETLDNLAPASTYYFRAYVVVQDGDDIKYYYGDVVSFRTAADTSISGDQKGWFELPQMNITKSGNYLKNSDNLNEYFAYVLCAGGEKGPLGTTARNYTVCYSGDHKCAMWVAAPRHSMYVGTANRTNSYARDNRIPADIQYSTKTVSASGYNKGHLLGSAERTSSTATNKQVFYYYNIAPQLTNGFNTGGGGWNTLEDWVDTKVCSDTLYEVIGCYFDTYTDAYGMTAKATVLSTYCGASNVSAPTMFYYALLRTKKGNSGKPVDQCSADELMCAAFVRSHSNSLKGQAVTSREMMSVADLEKITGFTYFANVPNAPKDTFKASDWGL